ncbi:MAG TPA: EamA family transporter [Stellaceae bacterium]
MLASALPHLPTFPAASAIPALMPPPPPTLSRSAAATAAAPRRAPVADYALLLLLATLWAASYSFIRIGVATIPPVTLIAARTLIAGGLLALAMRLRGVALPADRRTWAMFAFQALMNSVAPFTLIAWAEQDVEAGLATILNATVPIFAFLLTWLGSRKAAARREAVNGRKLLGVVIGLSGITLVIGVDALSGIGRQTGGQVAIVAASACYAVAAIFGQRFKGLDPMAPAAGSMLCGAAALVPLSLAVDRPWTLNPSAASLAALAGLAVFSTALAFIIYFRLLRSLGSIGITSQSYLRVPIGVLLGAVFLGESLPPTAYAGLVLVVAGVAAMTLPGRGGDAEDRGTIRCSPAAREK